MTALRVLALVLLVALAACASLSPGEHAHAIAALGEMLRAGVISQAQYDALVAALSGNWWESVVGWVLPVACAWLGVPWINNVTRGRIDARKGLAEALAKVQPVQEKQPAS